MLAISSILGSLKGKEVVISLPSGSVKAMLLSFDKDTILVEGDGKHFFIPVNKVSFIGCEKNEKTANLVKEFESLPEMTIIGCTNKNCSGVKMMKSGCKENIKNEDYKLMVEDCPMKNSSCSFGIVGDIKELKKEQLMNIMDNLVIGEYPQRQKGRPKKDSGTIGEIDA